MQAIAQHAGGQCWLRKAKGGPVARTACQTAAGPAENECKATGRAAPWPGALP